MQKKKNLSDVSNELLSHAETIKFGIVVADWNPAITHALEAGCRQKLIEAGADPENIHDLHVPGSFELPFGAKMLINEYKPDAVICIGCVIKGETSHNEYINHSISQGMIQLSLFANIPIIFGVLTPNNIEQAEARAGGTHGNKGIEAAATAIRMVNLKKNLKESQKRIGFA